MYETGCECENKGKLQLHALCGYMSIKTFNEGINKGKQWPCPICCTLLEGCLIDNKNFCLWNYAGTKNNKQLSIYDVVHARKQEIGRMGNLLAKYGKAKERRDQLARLTAEKAEKEMQEKKVDLLKAYKKDVSSNSESSEGTKDNETDIIDGFCIQGRKSTGKRKLDAHIYRL